MRFAVIFLVALLVEFRLILFVAFAVLLLVAVGNDEFTLLALEVYVGELVGNDEFTLAVALVVALEVYVGGLVGNDEFTVAVPVTVAVVVGATVGATGGAVEVAFIVVTDALAAIETVVFVIFVAKAALNKRTTANSIFITISATPQLQIYSTSLKLCDYIQYNGSDC